MPTVHFLCGFMGFGKTTIARRLAVQYSAVRLNNDDFMRILYGRNLPEEQFRPAKQKVVELTWQLAEQIVAAGSSVIFDSGFWSRQSRLEAYERAKHFCDSIMFHQIECDMETAKQRVLNRTATDETSLFIDENCFDMFASAYEPISPDERYDVIYYRNV